jgi:hypothetical protein
MGNKMYFYYSCGQKYSVGMYVHLYYEYQGKTRVCIAEFHDKHFQEHITYVMQELNFRDE